ncbi:MAG: hypothetical protein HYY65_10740 [Candidatus Tectomicrobia bacterium]|uniref:Uncharacterized protein n=1 Tax=Tectimicrobiota bacterium TaxID=2528274 RepID=A0A932GR22_UNCTE|nr:hypothetical protein [Candidatus Tectomicrobia bacterium]
MKGMLRKRGSLPDVVGETHSSRRRLLTLTLAGAGVAAAAMVSGFRLYPRTSPSGGYRRVVGWNYPEGEGLFIAVKPEPSVDELRTLGRNLHQEFQDRDNMVVMIFDDSRAALDASRGSRLLGEKRFQAALAHQRAMYFKEAARGEDSLTIYAAYPATREVIRF